jgi:hypothetical protein
MLGNLQPAVSTNDKTRLGQNLDGFFHALRRGAQQLRQLPDLHVFVPQVGQDAQQLIKSDRLGP